MRSHYLKAAQSNENAIAFAACVDQVKSNNAVIQTYKGASKAIQSKFAKTIKEKKSLFTEGAQQIESSIKSHPENAEMRVIRLSIQENVPKFLKYSSNIQEDKKIILQFFGKQTPELKSYIKGYLVTSKSFSEKEIQSLQN